VGWGFGIGVLCWLSAARSGTTPERYGNDFTVFYAAARQVWLTGNPYEIPIRAATPYLYPPLFAQLLTPLAWLSLPVAAFLWAVGNILAVGWLWRLVQPVLPATPDQNLPHAGWWLVLGPVLLGNFLLGQVNLWIAALVTFALLADAQRQRAAAGGLALAAAVSVKISPVLLIPYFVGRRAWRLLAWWAVWMGLGNALSCWGWAPTGGPSCTTGIGKSSFRGGILILPSPATSRSTVRFCGLSGGLVLGNSFPTGRWPCLAAAGFSFLGRSIAGE